MATNDEQPQRRTPSSARLPHAALDDVIPMVEALAALGTPSTPHVIAQQMGTSYSTNSQFRTRLGAAGYYGFITRDGDRRRLTPRGEAVTGGDADAVRQARREAVMSTTFGPIIHSLRGRPVNETTIALRVQADHGVPERSAPTVASALVQSATQAELITDGRFDAVAIEDVAGVMPSPDEAAPSPAPRREKKEPEESRTPKDTAGKGKRDTVKEDPRPPFVPGVQVVVKIDASTLTPQEIAELVRALQGTGATTEATGS